MLDSQPIGVRLRGVEKTDPGATSAPVLSGLSCDIVPGEAVAVVGRSGAGKA